MRTVFIEVEHPFNWGKFIVGKFDEEEWSRASAVGFPMPLLSQCGWDAHHVWVFDIETGEAACFSPGGLPEADLKKHAIWVCPMFEPFLIWLYKQDLSDLSKLPRLVTFTEDDVPGSMCGHRRPGPSAEERADLLTERAKNRTGAMS